MMSEDSADRTSTRTEEFGRKSRLWFVIPLLIAGALTLWSRSAALGFVVFMLCFWLFLGAIALVLRATKSLVPQSFSDEHKAEIQQSVGGTVFLGGSAVIGMVLRGENVVSQFVARKVPDGFSIGFIDPTFAVVCIVGIWIYTAYRLRN